ncbi:MAG: NUDIX domain-containing protein [Anaerolineae bacterium]
MPLNPAPPDIRFCPKCATPLVTRQVGDKPRRACPACNFIHFTDPKVGVGVFVVQAGKVLLVRRRMKPERGKWSIPAGFLDYGEDPQVTAVREALEETGLTVEIEGVVDVYHNPPGQGGASIFILYRARAVDGRLQAGDDADAAGFFALDELPELAFASTRDAIRLLSSQI